MSALPSTVFSEIPVMHEGLGLQSAMMMRWRSAFLRSARTFRPFTQQLAKSSSSAAVTLMQNLSDRSRHFAQILFSLRILLRFQPSRGSAGLISPTHPHSCLLNIPRWRYSFIWRTGPVEWTRSAVRLYWGSLGVRWFVLFLVCVWPRRDLCLPVQT